MRKLFLFTTALFIAGLLPAGATNKSPFSSARNSANQAQVQKSSQSKGGLFAKLFGGFSRTRTQVVRTTAYTHTESDHLEYGKATAVGTQLRCTEKYNSAAADWSRFPLGTTFRIKGSEVVYVVDDYGRALVGTDTIDIYRPCHGTMDDWGVRNVEIEILEEGDPAASREILSQRLQYAHCRHMFDELGGRTS